MLRLVNVPLTSPKHQHFPTSFKKIFFLHKSDRSSPSKWNDSSPGYSSITKMPSTKARQHSCAFSDAAFTCFCATSKLLSMISKTSALDALGQRNRLCRKHEKKLLPSHCFSSFSHNHEFTGTQSKSDVIISRRRHQPPPAVAISAKCPTADVRNQKRCIASICICANRKRIGRFFFHLDVDTSMLKRYAYRLLLPRPLLFTVSHAMHSGWLKRMQTPIEKCLHGSRAPIQR